MKITKMRPSHDSFPCYCTNVSKQKMSKMLFEWKIRLDIRRVSEYDKYAKLRERGGGLILSEGGMRN